MFGPSNSELKDVMLGLAEMIEENNRRLLELKVLVLDNKTSTLANGVAIKKEKSPVRVIEKEITVTRARKKPRQRLRTTGGKRITEYERRQFVELYDQGLSFTEISGITGRSASSISTYIWEQKKGTDETN